MWDTLIPLLIGAAITLFTTAFTTIGAELFREWRTDKLQRKSRRLELLNALQDLATEAHTLAAQLDAELDINDESTEAASRRVEMIDTLTSKFFRILAMLERLPAEESKSMKDYLIASYNYSTDNNAHDGNLKLQSMITALGRLTRQLGKIIRNS